MDAINQPEIDLNKRTDQYVKLRDKIKEIEERHDLELKPYKEALERLGNVILGHLNDMNVKSVSTLAGTPYKTIDVTATLADKDAFWTWVVTQGKFEFIDYKANKTRVKEYVEEKTKEYMYDPENNPPPTAPPGVNYSQRWKLGVTRAAKKS